ncbi:telomere recombination family protein [Bordetella holmesii 41130]|nr:telomere recombination family protein [Bordetella holmesii 41130]
MIEAAIAAAAQRLAEGGLVAFPTETVYGLGADAESAEAVAGIYLAKGRPANHPVIVHVAPGADLGHWAIDVPAQAQRLIEAFWPGPLTLILKRRRAWPRPSVEGRTVLVCAVPRIRWRKSSCVRSLRSSPADRQG